MSYPYHGQYPDEYPDEYSAPATPRDVFPQWETLEHQPQAQGSQMPAQQQDMMSQPSPLTPSQTPLYTQHILDQSGDPFVPSQPSPIDDSVLLHSISHESSTEASSSRHRSSLRQSPPRTRAQHRLNPYGTRPDSSAGPSSNTRRRQRQDQPPQLQQLRFIQQLPPPPVTRPVTRRSSPLPSSPLATTSVTNRDRVPPRLLAIRLDWRYDPTTRMIIAYFELPGVKREDISVTLSTCFYNRTKQVTVTATRLAPFLGATSTRDAVPGRDFFWIEGKYGACRRSIVVSSECKPEDIEARLQDGVLLLKINCGPADDKNEVTNIPLR